MPFTIPYTFENPAFRASPITPAREAFIATVGPPDWPTMATLFFSSRMDIFFLLLLMLSIFASKSFLFYHNRADSATFEADFCENQAYKAQAGAMDWRTFASKQPVGPTQALCLADFCRKTACRPNAGPMFGGLLLRNSL